MPSCNTRRRWRVKQQSKGHKVRVPASFLVTSLLVPCFLAFCGGRAARYFLSEHYPSQSKTFHSPLHETEKEPKMQSYLFGGSFGAAWNAPTSCCLHKRDVTALLAEENADLLDTDHNHTGSNANVQELVTEHLMVDIKNVDSSFLNSERRLANAMLEVVSEANLRLRSYYCHGLAPFGVSCVSLLKQNHIALHTWPESGVITFDLCVSGTTLSLLSVVPVVERVFGVPSTSSDITPGLSAIKPEMRWALKPRGFNGDKISNDLNYILGEIGNDVKTKIVSTKMDFQKVDIYDLEPNKNRLVTVDSRMKGEFHEPQDPLVYHPGRIMLLDGWTQSTLLHDAAYHEALVHPALFAHGDPKRVVIVGGGEGATLREVLKHNTVKEAVLIANDEKMVKLSMRYIPEWSDCSDIEGSASSWCSNDPRASMYYEDAFVWFIDRLKDKDNAQTMDILIIDMLDLESEMSSTHAVYSNMTIMEVFYNSLSDDGVMVLPLDESPEVWSADETNSRHRNRASTMHLLEYVGFESIHLYEEGHCGFDGAHLFAVAFKSYRTRKTWFANPAEIDLAIQKRTLRTKSGESILRYFDGATMASYQVPPRSVESVFCHRSPTPSSCIDNEFNLLYNPEVPNAPISSFEVKKSRVGENAGRGLFTKVEIPANTYIAAEASAHPIHFFPMTYELIFKLKDACDYNERMKALTYYIDGYGFTNQIFGDLGVFVDSSIVTFVNHGCRSTYNVGIRTEVNEFTAELDRPVETLNGKAIAGSDSIFDPLVDRHLVHTVDTSLKDIAAGNEILSNYLVYIGSEEFWAEDVTDLRNQCSGFETEGSVSEYERLDNAEKEKE